jgi:hypothetical protein
MESDTVINKPVTTSKKDVKLTCTAQQRAGGCPAHSSLCAINRAFHPFEPLLAPS